MHMLGKGYSTGSETHDLNIPILPIGFLDFCKQKLTAPPLWSMSHLVGYKEEEEEEEEDKEEQKEEQEPVQTIKGPPPGGA